MNIIFRQFEIIIKLNNQWLENQKKPSFIITRSNLFVKILFWVIGFFPIVAGLLLLYSLFSETGKPIKLQELNISIMLSELLMVAGFWVATPYFILKYSKIIGGYFCFHIAYILLFIGTVGEKLSSDEFIQCMVFGLLFIFTGLCLTVNRFNNVVWQIIRNINQFAVNVIGKLLLKIFRLIFVSFLIVLALITIYYVFSNITPIPMSIIVGAIIIALAIQNK